MLRLLLLMQLIVTEMQLMQRLSNYYTDELGTLP